MEKEAQYYLVIMEKTHIMNDKFERFENISNEYMRCKYTENVIMWCVKGVSHSENSEKLLVNYW